VSDVDGGRIIDGTDLRLDDGGHDAADDRAPFRPPYPTPPEVH